MYGWINEGMMNWCMHGGMNQWIILSLNGYKNGWMNGSW